MNPEIYIFAGVAAGMLLIVGLVIVIANHMLKMVRDEKMLYALEKEVLGRAKKVTIETMRECMDILPEKLMEAKRIIESE